MLTTKQRELLDFIAAHQERHGISPSFEEMMLGLGLKSKSGVHRLISALEERGFIRRLPNRARALEIIADPEEQKAIRRRDRNISLLHLSNDELLRECFRRNLVRRAA